MGIYKVSCEYYIKAGDLKEAEKEVLDLIDIHEIED